MEGRADRTATGEKQSRRARAHAREAGRAHTQKAWREIRNTVHTSADWRAAPAAHPPSASRHTHPTRLGDGRSSHSEDTHVQLAI
eukprot:3916582-Prymnesium_polylepis.1